MHDLYGRDTVVLERTDNLVQRGRRQLRDLPVGVETAAAIGVANKIHWPQPTDLRGLLGVGSASLAVQLEHHSLAGAPLSATIFAHSLDAGSAPALSQVVC